MRQKACSVLLFIFTSGLSAATSDRYALILQDEPVGVRTGGPEETRLAAEPRRAAILSAQAAVRSQVESQHIVVTGTVQSLMNAVFVQASPDRVDALRAIPGVKAVVRLRVRYRKLDRAAALINAPAAWSALGGIPDAGLGLRIGIIDTGIDQTHPAFQDNSLPAVPHICSGSDCSYTNNKVIVARSYIRSLAAGTPPNPAADSRPDDYSPQDHSGHGTAVAMVAAGNTNTGPTGETITGIAPKAYLGNYKVYGSAGINDGATDDVLIQAVEDAFNDGMNVVNLSSGGLQFSGPLDTGSACGNPTGVPCDLAAAAYETAAQKGLIVAVAAGNEADLGNITPTLATLNSPASAPDVIAVAASTNSHTFLNGIAVSGPGVPSNLQSIVGEFGDGPVPASPLTAPAKDIASVGDPLGCSAPPASSLTGYIALIGRGTCDFSVKVQNAQNAGAVGVILTLANSTDRLIAPGGLTGTNIPTVLIGQADGQNLRSYVTSTSAARVTIDFNTLVSQDVTPDLITDFSSRGPALIAGLVKPDITAVGTDIYMAAERTDPTGALYSPNGYTAASGTSFSTPMVAGAAALVKQAHPSWTAAQIKSALLNSANSSALTDNGTAATIVEQGAGKLDVAAAVGSSVTVVPQSVYFGALRSGASAPTAVPVQITNTGSQTLNLTLSGPARFTLDKASLSLAPGASGAVNVSVSGPVPAAGSYGGQIAVSGAPAALHIPVSFVVGTGVAYNIVALAGDQNTGNVGQIIPDGILAFQITDRYGVPVPNLAVRWTAQGGGTLSNQDSITDTYGIATAVAKLGNSVGIYQFIGSAGGQSYVFEDDGELVPTILSGGVVNAASSQLGQGIAPGSYVTIYGTGLATGADMAASASLPLSLDLTSVSFDVPSAGISVPGLIYYVSPSQVNVQVPWELAGQSSVQMKVSIDQQSGTVATVPLSTYSPAIFVYGASQAAALDANNAVIGTSNPARRGQVISIYANGLGPVNNQPASGQPAPSSPLATTQAAPSVTIGGVSAPVQFAGLAPGFTGLYQLNVTVPSSAAVGSQPLTVSIGGQTSPSVNLNIQ